MSKKISRLLLAVLLIILTVSSFSVCLAETDVENTQAVTTTSENDNTPESSENKIHNGDLYLFNNNVVMDKLVDGNVFIFGNNVEITGQINGNLFVFANKLKLDKCSVRYSIYACANSVYYNGACTDLYVSTNNLEMTYDSYVIRDVKAVASDIILKAAVGRDVDLKCNTVDFGEAENVPIIYGNLRYSAPSETTIPEGVMGSDDSTSTYTKSSNTINILLGFLSCIITALVIYALTKKLTPNFAEKLSTEKFSAMKLLKSLGLGLALLFIVLILGILLLLSTIGTKLALILIALFTIISLIAVPLLSIVITNALKPVFKTEKTSMFCLILSLITIVLYGLTFIPFVGTILGIIIKLTAMGFLVNMCLPHKKLSDEEKAKNKALKAERKKEKAESKKAKKTNKEDK